MKAFHNGRFCKLQHPMANICQISLTNSYLPSRVVSRTSICNHRPNTQLNLIKLAVLIVVDRIGVRKVIHYIVASATFVGYDYLAQASDTSARMLATSLIKIAKVCGHWKGTWPSADYIDFAGTGRFCLHAQHSIVRHNDLQCRYVGLLLQSLQIQCRYW